MTDGKVKQTSITLTPVGEGRFEIYLDGKKLYDRNEAGDKDFYRSLGEIRKIRRVLDDALAAAPARA